MKRLSIMALALASLALSPQAQATPTPITEGLAQLCPASGPAGLVFAEPANTQDKAALAALKWNGRFGRGKAQFTSWSERLFAVEWHKPSPDGKINWAWLNEVEKNLLASGWEPLPRPNIASLSALNSRMVTKTVAGRRLVIEFDAPGIQLIRCADLDLLELDARERENNLSPGSPRPVPPAPPARPFALPDAKVCANQEMTDAFSGISGPWEFGELAEKHFPLSDPASELATYERRLGVWLEWKLRSEGGYSEAEVWALDQNDGRPNKENDAMIALLGTMGQAFAAEKAKDGRKLCEAMIAILGGLHANAEIDASEGRRRNAILEAEVARLGIALD